ncbi:ROK family protein [Shewanella waksmanii]|uniref:ROK family protein n=1 Tax=Shewanella waksmanii TaxID=213783 RepID=UPI003736B778
MRTHPIVTLDIGGTTLTVGNYDQQMITASETLAFPADAELETITKFIINCIDKFFDENTQAIAIGVPCIVNTEQGIIYDAVNIPAWREFGLKQVLEQHYQRPVYINNDVNCFTAGEHRYGAGKAYQDIIGLCLGTGVGSGFIINNRLHEGHNCSAGEVGEVSYKDATIDDYASGRFFDRYIGTKGATLAEQARQGDAEAQAAFEQFGQHVAYAISQLLLILDPQVIVLGGSVAKSFDLFSHSVWQSLASFPYQKVIKNLQIVTATEPNSALLGAAQLYLDSQSKPAPVSIAS